MQFTKTLAAFLVGAASLVSFANAAALPVSDVSEAVKRDAGAQLLARWVAPAGFTGVQMGNSATAMSFENGLYTEGLVTCIGVIITGTPPQIIRPTRFLVHLTGSWWIMESQWTAFQNAVEQADLKDKRAWISVPDTSAMDAELKEQTDNAVSQVNARINALVGSDATPATHPFNMPQTLPAGSMQVTKDNEVSMGGVIYP